MVGNVLTTSRRLLLCSCFLARRPLLKRLVVLALLLVIFEDLKPPR
jgi:hypothetical protein